MGRRSGVGAIGLFFALVLGGMATAAELRILYAEPVAFAYSADYTAATFTAYGRQFDLELEPNRRLLQSAAVARKPELARLGVYRGRIAGVPHSWVRLTRDGEELRGVIWDGTDLYAIEPAYEAEPFLVDTAVAASSASLVYRLSDAQLALSGQFCTVLGADGVPTTGGGSALESYRKLVRELQYQASQVPASQIEIAAIGDFEFFSLNGGSSSAALLAELNIVDGIFGEQVGVTIVVSELRIFDTAADPFTSSNPSDLLGELLAFRRDTPAIRQRGLAHLSTGRDLDGQTAGVAFLDSLCHPELGVSLGEGWLGSTTSALVAAHEIGHNFGAPHDAETGSPCESTPAIFLMAPVLNGSSTFSQCSLDQIRPRIAAASCITASQLADATVQVAPSPLRAFTGQPFNYPIDVSAIGTADSTGVVITATLAGGLVVTGATVPGDTCTSGAGTLRCELGTVAASTTRRIDVTLRADQIGTYQTSVSVTSSNDRESANNAQAVEILVDATADVSASVSPDPITGFTREPIDFTVTVRSAGAQPATDVQALVNVSAPFPLQVLSVSGGTCTAAGRVTCTFGALNPGESRDINLRVVPTRQGNFQSFASVSATNDGNSQNNVRPFGVLAAASNDVGIQVTPELAVVAVNTTTTFTATVRSIGPQPAANVVATFFAFPGAVLEAVSVAGSPCPLQSGNFACSFGDLPSGAQRVVDLRVRPTAIGSAEVNASVGATVDDFFGNDSTRFRMQVREAVDVSVSTFGSQSLLETRTQFLNFQVSSRGVNAAADVVATLDVPAGVSVVAAQMFDGSCAVIGNSVRCTRASLPTGMQVNVNVTLRGDQLGTYSAPITVTASGDADPSNNSTTVELTVLPFIDAGIDQLSAMALVLLGDVWEFPLVVRTGIRPVSGVTVELNLNNALNIESAITGTGTCTINAAQMSCALGNLAAQSVTPITVRARAAVLGGFGIFARVTAPNDVDGANDARSGSVTIEERADVTVTADAATFTATVNQPMQYGLRLSQVGPQRVNDARVEISLPGAVVVDSASSDGGLCVGTSTGLSCGAGDILNGNVPRISLVLRSGTAGSFQSTATVSARNDVNAQNNSTTVTLVFNAAPPPPPPPSSGGGGGGGASNLYSLLGLFLALSVAIPRRFRR